MRAYDDQVFGTQAKHGFLMALRNFRKQYKSEPNWERTKVELTFDLEVVPSAIVVVLTEEE